MNVYIENLEVASIRLQNIKFTNHVLYVNEHEEIKTEGSSLRSPLTLFQLSNRRNFVLETFFHLLSKLSSKDCVPIKN